MDDDTRSRLISALSRIAEAIVQEEAERVDHPYGYEPLVWEPGMSVDRDIRGGLSTYFLNPVGRALRAGIREIGEVLLPSIGYHDLLELVEGAARNTSNYDVALGALTHQWDGLHTLDGRRWTV